MAMPLLNRELRNQVPCSDTVRLSKNDRCWAKFQCAAEYPARVRIAFMYLWFCNLILGTRLHGFESANPQVHGLVLARC